MPELAPLNMVGAEFGREDRIEPGSWSCRPFAFAASARQIKLLPSFRGSRSFAIAVASQTGD